MRILCDVDGVFADFLGHTLATLGPLAPEKGVEAFTSWNLLDTLNEEAREVSLRAWSSEGWCESIPPYPSSIYALSALSSLGKVYWVTAPLRDSKYWHYERLTWLKRHLGADDADVVFTHDKCHVWGDAIIDDRLENVEAWAKAHPKGLAILWDHPYNRERTPLGIRRASSWAQVLQLLRNL